MRAMLRSMRLQSWLMVARKSPLSRFDSYSAMLAWASSSTLRSMSAFTLPHWSCMLTRLRSLRLHARDVAEHAVAVVAHGGQEVALEPVRFVQRHVGLGQLVHLAVHVRVYLAPLVLHAHEVAEPAAACARCCGACGCSRGSWWPGSRP